MRVLGDVGGVEDGDGERDGPDPDHLEDPEAEEGPELVALVVEAVVLASLEDTEEEEGGESSAPGQDEEGVDDLPGVGGRGGGGAGGEGEGQDGEEDEVGPAGEVGELVEFEGEGDAEADELVGDRNEEGDGQVVVVEDADGGGRHGEVGWWFACPSLSSNARSFSRVTLSIGLSFISNVGNGSIFQAFAYRAKSLAFRGHHRHDTGHWGGAVTYTAKRFVRTVVVLSNEFATSAE